MNTDNSVTLTLALYFIWYFFAIVQSFPAYGTAYRKTNATGDNGVSLFGWMLLYILAALVPGPGIYLWKKEQGPGLAATIPAR